MEIIRSSFTGFCKGVLNAIEIATKAKNQYKSPCLSSIIVHNREVSKSISIPLFDKHTSHDCFIISAHGCDSELLEYTKSKNIKILDATCPLVQNNISLALLHDGDIIYIGSKNHSEVKFFLSHLGKKKIAILENLNDAINFIGSNIPLNFPKVFVQTTFSKDLYEKICTLLKSKYFDLSFAQSLCSDCLRRREEVANLSKEADLVIVVGDEISSNANELLSLSLQTNPRSFLVLNREGLEKIDFSNVRTCAMISSSSSSYQTFESIYSALLNK